MNNSQSIAERLENLLRRMKPDVREQAISIIRATLSRFDSDKIAAAKQKSLTDFAAIKAGRWGQPDNEPSP